MVDPTHAVILQSASYVFEKEAEEGKANGSEWNLGSSGTKVRSGMSRAATSPHLFVSLEGKQGTEQFVVLFAG